MIPLHRCVCIWTTFLVCLLLSSLCGFGVDSAVCLGGYLPKVPWSVVDDFGQQQQQHSFDGGGVGM